MVIKNENIENIENNSPFKELKIKRYNLHMQIADQVEEFILKNKLSPNTKLPSERAFSEQLGVNRATFREAIRLLEQRGIVQIIQGRGIFVFEVPHSTVTDSIRNLYYFGKCTNEDLMIIRDILEPEIAALAAINAVNEEIEKLEKIINKIKKETDPNNFLVQDEVFHKILADATHNNLIVGIINGLRTPLLNLRRETIMKIRIIDRKANVQVFEAVKNKDPDTAKNEMRKHMEIARRLLIDS